MFILTARASCSSLKFHYAYGICSWTNRAWQIEGSAKKPSNEFERMMGREPVPKETTTEKALCARGRALGVPCATYSDPVRARVRHIQIRRNRSGMDID